MSNRFQVLFLAIPVIVSGMLLHVEETVAAQSPFVPSGGNVVKEQPEATNADLEALQLSGISALGPEFRFNLVNSKTKKSFWVGLNRSVAGFTVTSYDSRNSAVVVEHGGYSRRIALRKPMLIARASPAPVATPLVVPEAYVPIPDTVEGVDEIKDPKTPEEIKQAEYEARMMVSDLLQISMQERERQRLLREQQKQNQ